MLKKVTLLFIAVELTNAWRASICSNIQLICKTKPESFLHLKDICCNQTTNNIHQKLYGSLQLPPLNLPEFIMKSLGGETVFKVKKPRSYSFETCSPMDLYSTTTYKVKSTIGQTSWENYLFPLPEAISVRMQQEGLWEGYIPRGMHHLFPFTQNGKHLVNNLAEQFNISPIILDIGSHVGVHGVFFGTFFHGAEIHAFDLLYENTNLFACSGKHAGFWLPNTVDFTEEKKREIRLFAKNKKVPVEDVEKLVKNMSSQPKKGQTKLYINLLALVNDDEKIKTINVETNDINKGQTRMSNSVEPNYSYGEFKNTVPRPTTTLDNYWKNVLKGRRPFLFKIDVEGSEWNVLQGAKKLFEETPPLIVVFDIHPFNMPAEDAVNCAKFLKKHGYTIFAHMPSTFEVPTIETGNNLINLPEILPVECLAFDDAHSKNWKESRHLHNLSMFEWLLSNRLWTKYGEAELTIVHNSVLPHCASCKFCSDIFSEIEHSYNIQSNTNTAKEKAAQRRIQRAYGDEDL